LALDSNACAVLRLNTANIRFIEDIKISFIISKTFFSFYLKERERERGREGEKDERVPSCLHFLSYMIKKFENIIKVRKIFICNLMHEIFTYASHLNILNFY